MKFLQKLGKALMLPVAVLPICGILMGIGYALCPSTMQGGDVTGIVQQIGYYLVKAGGALIDNMAILFAIGIGVGLADENDGTGGLAALVSWLMITNLLATANVTVIMPSIAENVDATLAFDKIANPFIGILAGVIGGLCYNKFKSTKLPDWLSFFSGKRSVAIVAGVVSIIVSVVLLFVWPIPAARVAVPSPLSVSAATAIEGSAVSTAISPKPPVRSYSTVTVPVSPMPRAITSSCITMLPSPAACAGSGITAAPRATHPARRRAALLTDRTFFTGSFIRRPTRLCVRSSFPFLFVSILFNMLCSSFLRGVLHAGSLRRHAVSGSLCMISGLSLYGLLACRAIRLLDY